jgi:phosphonate transport system substrate-binding protein
LSATDLINAKDAELLLVGEIGGKTTYKSYWLALKEKPYEKVEDLRGKPVAFASKTSTSGFIIPLWDLRRKNLVSEKADPEDFFGKGNVFYGTGYVTDTHYRCTPQSAGCGKAESETSSTVTQ